MAKHTGPVLFRWPARAAFGRAVPKTRFYERGKVRSVLREKFINDIRRITWAYKLADSTIQLPGNADVPEIQVFTIATKGGDVADDVLTAIDRSVHFPVIFEIANTERIRMVAAHKTLAGVTPKVGPYFTTEWQPADAPRGPLPTAVDLSSLYEAILISLLPMQTRVGETVSSFADRMNQVRRLQREIAALERKLRTEPQLNRKFELRTQLERCTTALAELTDPCPVAKDDCGEA